MGWGVESWNQLRKPEAQRPRNGWLRGGEINDLVLLFWDFYFYLNIVSPRLLKQIKVKIQQGWKWLKTDPTGFGENATPLNGFCFGCLLE